jgi:hypothetical protein
MRLICARRRAVLWQETLVESIEVIHHFFDGESVTYEGLALLAELPT